MDAILKVDPGLIIWTIFNFLIFLFLLLKFGTKPIMNGLNSREKRISDSIEQAEKLNLDSQKMLKESEAKLNNAQLEMAEIIKKGRLQSEEFLKNAALEAESIKKHKIDEAISEIDHSKEIALKELRKEVANLVVGATAKILETELDKDKHYKLVESYINKIPKN